MFYRTVLFIVVLISSPFTQGYTIGVPEYMRGSDYQQQVESAFTNLYETVGIDAEFAYLPFTRMMRMADQQQLDAVAYQLVTQSPTPDSVVRVPEPITQIRLLAACLDDTGCNLDIRSRIVIVKDVLFARQLCDSLSLDCLEVKSPELARKALRNGLVDAHIVQWSSLIREPCLESEGITLHPIAHTEMNIYHYVARQHSGMTDTLASNIRTLKQQAQNVQNGRCNAIASIPVFL